jgi:hypothetical protein
LFIVTIKIVEENWQGIAILVIIHQSHEEKNQLNEIECNLTVCVANFIS